MKKIFIIVIILLFSQFAYAQMEIGANFGAPAFFNAALGYWFNPVGLRISGMYLAEDSNGIQFNLMYNYSVDGTVFRSFGLAVGSSQDPGCDWSYLGPVYDYVNESFFLELGLVRPIAVRRGDFSDIFIFPLLQIGYTYQF